ncbi:MAG: TetR/AcrR family transcriptional regulator [Gammaproteobacteria bacterium]|nr:MAG: TetR/AcrR family transcriptional regulator [Gammaproteobacteria bacterium]
MSRPRKQPRQQRSRATWDAILDAAAQLFGELGYAATTTNKVAERAGVSIGSLYQYFPDKDALLLALAERHLSEATAVLVEAFTALQRDRPDLEGTLTRLIDAVVALHRRDPAMHRLLFDQTPRTPEMATRLRSLEQRLAAAVAIELKRLGVGGPQPEARALLLVQAVEAQVHGAVLDPPDNVPVEVLVHELRELWLRALG